MFKVPSPNHTEAKPAYTVQNSTYVPTVTISASKSVEPSTLELAITGYAPTITIREIPASALKYTLEVRNSSGNLVSILENAFTSIPPQK